jgi:hypothetical protein
VLAAAVVAGCGGGGDDDSTTEAADIPAGAVAKVGETEISKEDLDEQVEALTRAQRGSGVGQDTKQGRQVLQGQALAMLLNSRAIEQEAADRGIEVSREEIAERWEAASGKQFKTAKARRRFLGGQTEQDLLDQLRLQVLVERIEAQVFQEAGGGAPGTKAVARYRREFRQRWDKQTVCAKSYDAVGCTDG